MPPTACRRGRTIPRWSTATGWDRLLDESCGSDGRSMTAPPQAGHQSASTSGASNAWQLLQMRSMKTSLEDDGEARGQAAGAIWHAMLIVQSWIADQSRISDAGILASGLPGR